MIPETLLVAMRRDGHVVYLKQGDPNTFTVYPLLRDHETAALVKLMTNDILDLLHEEASVSG